MRYSLLGALLGAASVSASPLLDSRDQSKDNTCHVEVIDVKLTSLHSFVGHSFPLLTPADALKNLHHKLSGGGDVTPTLQTYNPAGAPVTKTKPAAAAGTGSASKLSDIVNGTVPTNAPDLGDVGSGLLSSYLPQLSSALAQLTKPNIGLHTPTAKVTISASSLASGSKPSPSSGTYTGSAPFPSSSTANYTTVIGTGSAKHTTVLPTTMAAATGTATSTSASSSSSSSSGSSTSSGSSSSSSTTSGGAAPKATTKATTSSSSSSATSSKTSSSSSTSASASASGSCSNPSTRVEWRRMATADKAAYVKAEKCLFTTPSQGGLTGSQNRHEDLTALHQQLNPIIHGVGQFLAWHRYFLHVHEVLLRTECAYAGPMPWWDETLDSGKFASSPLFTSEYFGTSIAKTGDGLGACITDGAFANTELNVGPGNSNTQHCLSRAIDEGLSADVSNNFMASCVGSPAGDFAGMQNCLFPGPHAYGHDAVGAVMSDVATSPGDPVFYLHHGMIDRAWAKWQAASTKNANAIGGFTTSGGNVPTTLQYMLTTLTVQPDVAISKVMDIKGGYLCYEYDY